MDALPYDQVAGSTQLEDRLYVLDSAWGRTAAIDLASGDVVATSELAGGEPDDPGTYSEPHLLGLQILSYRQAIYVTANIGTDPVGKLFELDPSDLSVRRQMEIPPGATDLLPDDTGRLWLIGTEPGRRFDFPSVTIVNLGNWTSEVIRLPGTPAGLALGQTGSMMVSLYDRDSVLELDQKGRVKSRLNGLPPGPWGIAVADARVAVVVSEGTADTLGGVSFIDLRRMRIVQTVDIAENCRTPREIALLGRSALVTCVGIPGRVAILDIDSRRPISAVSFAPSTSDTLRSFDEPKSLSIVSPPSGGLG